MASTGSPRRTPDPKNANDSRVPNTMWANTSKGWLAIRKVVKTSGARTRKLTTYRSSPYTVPAKATVPLVRNRGTASANTIPNRADSTTWTTTPSAGLVVPAAIAWSRLTMVEIIRSGISALPPVLWANHMVTAANTIPAATPPTAPRTNRRATGSSVLLCCVAAMAIASSLDAAVCLGRTTRRGG
jgi:hypothetical protein